MQRYILALGVLIFTMHIAAARAQHVGAWQNSPPDSKAIVHDEKGRRLFWDANGQVVGRYSYHTGKYTAVSPGEQRDTSTARLPDLPPLETEPPPVEPAVIVWGRGREGALGQRGPKIIQGPTNAPTVLRYGVESSRPESVAGTPNMPKEFTTPESPMGMP